MAFRGLYPYQEGDTLPGQHRQREALTIFTQLTDADFRFGVVCGESGCGKNFTATKRVAKQSERTWKRIELSRAIIYLNRDQRKGAEYRSAGHVLSRSMQTASCYLDKMPKDCCLRY